MKTFWIETYGCQMNKAESESLTLKMRDCGWTKAESPFESDVVIINTCSVRITAEERVWGRIGFFRHEKKKRPLKLVIIGCMAERLKDELVKKAPEVDVVIGNFNKQRVVEYLDHLAERDARRIYADNLDYSFSERHSERGPSAYVPVMHGCDNFCSYCIVPYVRGREVSRSVPDIITEVDSLVANGAREIILLGQNVNSYSYTNGRGTVRFQDLLEIVSVHAGSPAWVRFLTSHPRDISDGLLNVIAARPNICKHVHLPIQHASDPVLERMNRGYGIAYIRNLMRSMRDTIGDVAITTDILLGFPGETEEDFKITLDALSELEFDDAYTYKYNPREGTSAFSLPDDVPENEKLRRLGEVIKLQRSISREKKKLRIGKTLKALAVDISKKNTGEILAKTEHDDMVVFPGSERMLGDFVFLELTGLSGNTFKGRELSLCRGN